MKDYLLAVWIAGFVGLGVGLIAAAFMPPEKALLFGAGAAILVWLVALFGIGFIRGISGDPKK